MISNEELVAKVEEAKLRPNCLILALLGATHSHPLMLISPSPTAAAKEAQKRGLSKEDVQRVRWIAMYLQRDLGEQKSLLAEFLKSENRQKQKPTKGEDAMPEIQKDRTELVERELLDI